MTSQILLLVYFLHFMSNQSQFHHKSQTTRYSANTQKAYNDVTKLVIVLYMYIYILMKHLQTVPYSVAML